MAVELRGRNERMCIDRSRRYRKIPLVCAASALLMLAAATQGAWAQDDVREFSIAVLPLAKALLEFSKQSNRDVIVRSELIVGKSSVDVRGTMSAREALELLLRDSQLAAVSGSDGSFVIVDNAPGTASDTPLSDDERVGDPPSGPSDDLRTTSRIPTDEAGVAHGTISGKVSQHGSNYPLAGALVRIVETGQTAVTDSLGNFRFVSVPAGNLTVSVFYLGFVSVVTEVELEAGANYATEIVLGDLVTTEEVVIYGSRSSRALALNQERTAENASSVTSADTLGSFTGTTISEALRRSPGVSFQRDRVTGEGTNIIVRGLSPDFNHVELNGLSLPVGSGVGRAADLSNLMVDSVDKITINKSLLPSHDSAGTGGLVEIETKSPLGRPKRFASFTAEGGKRGKGFNDDLLASGTISGTFGSEQPFGLGASIQYRRLTNQTISYDANLISGQALPLDPSGGTAIDSTLLIDPRRLFPFEAGIDQAYIASASSNFTEAKTTTLAATLSAEWQVAGNTSFKLDLQRTARKRDDFRAGVNISAGGFAALPETYLPTPVQALNGGVRQALYLGPDMTTQQFYSASRGGEDITDSASFRGDTTFDKWTYEYAIGYAQGSSSQPHSSSAQLINRQVIAAGLLLPEATDPVEGRTISPFGPRIGAGYPLPLLSEAGFAFANDPANFDLARASILRTDGENSRHTGKFSTKYDFDDDHVKYVEVGLDFESSKFSSIGAVSSFTSNLPSVFDPSNPTALPPLPSIASLGLDLSDVNRLSAIGLSRGFAVVPRADMESFLDNIRGSTGSPDSPLAEFLGEPHPLARDTFTREDELAGYVQGRIDIGKLEVIGGARLSRVNVRSRHLVTPGLIDVFGVPDLVFEQEFTVLADDEATQTKILPRFALNYRQNDNLVFRGGYFLTVARPQISNLSTTQVVRLNLSASGGPGFNQPELTVAEGNPGLRPATTHNFDVSLEYYSDDIGVLKLGGFYKRIQNLLENNFVFGSDDLSGVRFPDHPAFENLPADLFIVRSRPENNPAIATIWGVELHAERQFTFLPGFWAGFGVFANYTFSKSSKEFSLQWFSSPILDADGNFTYTPDPFDPSLPGLLATERVTIVYPAVPFDQQPERSGTVALTYNMHNIDATLAYGFQSRLQQSTAPFGLNPYSESVGTLDLRAEYRLEKFGGTHRFYFEVTDLLRGTSDADLETSVGGTRGVPRYVTGATYLGGRMLKLGMTASF